MICLWCNKECGENYFCVGGGPTKAASKTGEKKLTKSYCYESFLTMYKMSKALNIDLIVVEEYYVNFEPDIKSWYESIPLIYEEVLKNENANPC